MTPEMKLAQALGFDEKKTKEKKAFEDMPIEVLEHFLRSGKQKTASKKVAAKKLKINPKGCDMGKMAEVADAWGRELAQGIAKQAGLLQAGMGRAMQAAITKPLTQRVMGGAAVGALGGAATGDGSQGNVLSRAAGGALLGGAAGAAAKPGAMALGAKSRMAGTALKNTAKQTGNIAGYRAAQTMQKTRVGDRAARMAAKKPQAIAGAGI